MKKVIKNNLSWKVILPLFILTNVVFALMLLITIPKVMNSSGEMKLLDMMPLGYDVRYVNALLSALREKGRNAYLFCQIPLDMIYPFLFGITYCLLFAFILDKLGKLEGYLFYLCLLPLIVGVFDYCENFGIIAMLKSYPDDLTLLTYFTNVFTILKSLFTTIYFIVLIISLIVFGAQTFNIKHKRICFKSIF